MEGVKKWLSERRVRNGLYVHYSTPKLLEVVSSAQLRQWARTGEAGKLERAVLAGQGRRLLKEAGALGVSLKGSGEGDAMAPAHSLPALVARCDALHAAVERGSLLELQELLESDFKSRKLVTCRDAGGAGLLHKAIFYDYMDIAEWLVEHYPHLVHKRDAAGRTPLHYTASCRDPARASSLLEVAGAGRAARDGAGRTPGYYRDRPTLLALPAKPDMPTGGNNPPGLVIKRSNIRIWCHDCDMGKLQRVVWEGHGARLLSEVSNQPAVRRFLEAVPYIMNTIREIHKAVIANELETLIKHAGEPVPSQILSSRDANKMTVMHKAAGLGHGGILGYIADRYPQGINDVDNEGRTPLHYAAAVRDEQHLYDTLVSLGADEAVVDNKNRTPGYYINRPQEIDKNAFKALPDAPRTPSSAYPPSWDWKILDMEAIVDLNKKTKRKNTRASNENISSKNNSNSISEMHNRRMKASSTQEMIKHLPDLEDRRKINGNARNQETAVVEDNDVKDEIKDEEHTEEVIEKSMEGKEDDDSQVYKEVESLKEPKIDNNEQGDGNGDEAPQEDQNDNKENIQEYHDHNHEKNPADETHVASQEVELNSTDDNEETNIPMEEVNEKHENTEEETDTNNDNIDPKPEGERFETETHDNESKEDAASEGNNEHNEDDDDVKVLGDSNSEYSDIHQRSTAEANNTERGNDDGRNTQESLIEGVVSGDAEQETQDASIRDDTVQGEILVVESEIDPEVSELINTANMEMLATLVLNGEGSRLVGRRSGNAEIQAFLDNVPTYMQKINRVHLAAREGNIRDLQAALDRRKFAIARDPISPNGATPLHVATVFGKTNIMKYLGGRFPETLSAVDFEGRTALHYAAVLPDNGHYYNLLQQLGSNSKDLDDNGRSAEDYMKDSSLLPYSQLFSDYGISEEAAQSMLSDKGGEADGHMDIPAFRTDEGRYLAKSLGDPLIKGLTEVANVKPKDPVAFLASFLHNFPDHEKPRLGTQESNVIVMGAGEVENEQPPPSRSQSRSRSAGRAGPGPARPGRPIEVVTVDPQPEQSPDAPEPAFTSVNRDEHGQSMLHFAAARAHSRGALFQLLGEADASLGFRDELYRTARDISIQANVPENTAEIDRWVLHLAARGNTEKIMQLLLEGYDHILDAVDEEGESVTAVVAARGDDTMQGLLASIPAFEESREALHAAIRRGDLPAVRAAVGAEGGRTLARGQNSFGRTALHVAVLAQHEDIVAHLATTCPDLLRLGDNLERTPLHYAMGVEKMESLSRLLIRAGAKRVLKDLKGRQPSYYFMNKSDILRLKEEEEVY